MTYAVDGRQYVTMPVGNMVYTFGLDDQGDDRIRQSSPSASVAAQPNLLGNPGRCYRADSERAASAAAASCARDPVSMLNSP